MLPLISVCIVTYNHADYIADCLMGVLAQWGAFQLEILVGDDASQDATARIVQHIAVQYPNKIRLFSHTQNLGPSENLHFVIAQAQGDFIAHLDGDDYWLPGKLQAQLGFLQTHPDCSACYTNALVVNTQKHTLGLFNSALPETLNLEMLVRTGNFLNHSSLLYRAQHRGLLFAYPTALIDYRIHLLLATQGSLGFLNATLTVYRLFSPTSVQIQRREKTLVMYLEALLSMQPQVTPAIFRAGILRYCQDITGQLIARRRWQLLWNLLTLIQAHHRLHTTDLLLWILPRVGYLKVTRWSYRRICGRSLRILYHIRIK